MAVQAGGVCHKREGDVCPRPSDVEPAFRHPRPADTLPIHALGSQTKVRSALLAEYRRYPASSQTPRQRFDASYSYGMVWE